MRALLFVVIAGCADPGLVAIDENGPTDEAGAPLEQVGTATLRDGTIVLPAAITARAEVFADHVMFPIDERVLALRAPNVIVSGTGDGFIRRVYKVEQIGEAIRVSTTAASLADAVTHAAFHATFAEPMTVVESDIVGRVPLLDLEASGGMSIEPAFELGFTLADDAIQTFDIGVTATGAAKLEGTVAFTSEYHWAWGDEKLTKKPQLFRRAFALGPLPIVVVGRLSTSFAATSYTDKPVTFMGGITGTLAIDSHSSYLGGAWATDDASTFAAAQIGPAHGGEGGASLSIGIAPRFELAFYGVAGAEISFAAQAGGFGTICNAAVITGLQAATVGNLTLRFDALSKAPFTHARLWDQRVSLDALETCAE